MTQTQIPDQMTAVVLDSNAGAEALKLDTDRTNIDSFCGLACPVCCIQQYEKAAFLKMSLNSMEK